MKFLTGLVLAALFTTHVAADEGPVIGIGVGIHSVDHHPIVDQILPGQSAFKGGVKVGDRLVKIDGKNVDGLPVPEVANLLHGAVGTRVHVVVQRPGEKDTRSFTLKRQMLTLLPAPPTPP